MIDPFKQYFVNIGPNGTFHESGRVKTNPEDIDHLFAEFPANKVKLILHFHGGLVNESAGMDIAESMRLLYVEGQVAESAADASVYTNPERPDDFHVVSFVWETGVIETIFQQIRSLSLHKLFQKLLEHTLRRAAKRVSQQAGRGDEELSLEDVRGELSQDTPFSELDGPFELDEGELDEGLFRDELEEALEEDFADDEELVRLLEDSLSRDEADGGRGQLSTDFLDDIRDSLGAEEGRDGHRGLLSFLKVAKRVARVVWRVIRRYARRRAHGFYPTVIEELSRELFADRLGGALWGGVKAQAAGMWASNEGLVGDDMHAGTYFLSRLNAFQQARKGAGLSPISVDLSGHSAGSVAICELLKMVAGAQERDELSDVKFRHVAFLAPACRLDLFHQEIVQHPERFQTFRMFTMSDHFECQDRLVPLLYTRSLLYLISGILEADPDTEIAGMHRFHHGEAPFDEALHLDCRRFLTEVDARLVYSNTQVLAPDAEITRRSSAVKHGDFDNDVLTRESLFHIFTS